MREYNFKNGNIPWNKGVPHTSDTKKKISEGREKFLKTHPDFRSNYNFFKGMIPWNKGIPRTLEIKRQIGERTKEYLRTHVHPRGMLGKHHSLETITKIKLYHPNAEQKAKCGCKLEKHHKWTPHETRLCAICKKPMYVRVSSNTKYCSYKCLNGAKKIPPAKCKLCGKVLSRRDVKLCQPCYGKEKSGEKSHLWKGGITTESKRLHSSKEWRHWRKAVFKRDDFICAICKQRGGKLHPHHIMPFASYPEKRFDVSNGITLCVACHFDLHRKQKQNRKEGKK